MFMCLVPSQLSHSVTTPRLMTIGHDTPAQVAHKYGVLFKINNIACVAWLYGADADVVLAA